MKKSNTKMKCPQCGKLCKGKQGIKTHMSWAHDPAGKQKRLEAAKATGLARAGSNKRHAFGLVSDHRPQPRKKLQRAAIRDQVHFCPRCGTNLEAVSLAMGFNL